MQPTTRRSVTEARAELAEFAQAIRSEADRHRSHCDVQSLERAAAEAEQRVERLDALLDAA